MITSSHIIYGWAFAKGTKRAPDKTRTAAFVVGSFLPDIPVYTFFLIHGIILGTSQNTMWNELYFDSSWTVFFTLSHSLLFWPLLLLIAVFLKKHLLRYVTSAAIIHIVLDFFVHNDDAYAHFWPLSSWKFMSPISYWDPAHYGRIVGAIDSVIILGLLAWLFTKYPSKRARIGICLVGILYSASIIVPFLIF